MFDAALTNEPTAAAPTNAFANNVERCDHDDASACYEAARALRDADGVARNEMLAVQMLTKRVRINRTKLLR